MSEFQTFQSSVPKFGWWDSAFDRGSRCHFPPKQTAATSPTHPPSVRMYVKGGARVVAGGCPGWVGSLECRSERDGVGGAASSPSLGGEHPDTETKRRSRFNIEGVKHV